jgi:DNA processing protein
MIPNQEEILHHLALGNIPGIGEVSQKQLFSYFGSATAIFRATKGKLMQVPGIGAATAELIHNSTIVLKEAEIILAKAEAAGDRILLHSMPDYPERLRMANDSPALIFVAGVADLNPKRTVAIVGTRNSTPYGEMITREIVSFLKAHQVTIISGLAVGIDYAAHRAAVENDMQTFAVMANGMDKIYPRTHKPLAKEIVKKNGVLITEHPYGTMAEKHFFVSRNRIIAALADIVIIVEAATRGGALITAEFANSYNKEVLAVPGPIDQPFSVGCNRLIADHKASCLAEYQDILKAKNWDIEDSQNLGTATVGKETKNKLSLFPEHLNVDEQAILKYLEQFPQSHIDDVARNTALPINKASSYLLNLEFQGLIKMLPGKKFIRI